MGLPGQKCLSGVRTNGPKWHVRLGQMSGQSAMGWGAVWLGKDQVRTPIGVAGTSRSSLIIMYMVQVACNCISLFYILAQCTITVTAQFSLQFQANSTAKESSEFSTGDFFGDFWGFLARFWRPNQLSGQTSWKSESLSENPDKFGEIWWPLSGQKCPAAGQTFIG